MPQGFNQAYLFRYLGARDSELALETAVGFYREMGRVCAEAGADFMTVVIPTKPDVDGPSGRALSEALLAGLGLEAPLKGHTPGRSFTLSAPSPYSESGTS